MQGPKDALLKSTFALKNGVGSTTSSAFRIDNSPRGHFCAPHEFILSAPVLTNSELPDGQTMTYAVETDDNESFSSASTVINAVLVQTGAGGSGAAAAERRFRLPSNVEAYVRVKATNSGSGNASGKSATVSLVAVG